MRQRLPKARTDELEDNARLLRAWRNFHAEQLEEVLAGPDGAVIAPVIECLKTLGPGKAQTLIELVQARDWSIVGVEAKLAVLHETNTVIARIREKLGMEPIDDGLPGEPPNLSRIIRTILESPR
jgi:hypothetical protein